MLMLPSNSRVAPQERFTAALKQNNQIDKLMPLFCVSLHASQLESFLMSLLFHLMAADNLFAASEIQFCWK